MTLIAIGRQIGMRRLLPVTIALAAGLAAATTTLAWMAARSLVMPRRRQIPRTPADLGLAFEVLGLDGADGIRLAAWWVPAEQARGTVILVHGFRSTRDEMLDHAPYLHESGFDVLLYDARACGSSGGTMTTLGWRETADLRAVIDQVEARSEGRPIVVMGHSLGAATAILEGADDGRPAAFILEAPFTAIEDVVGRSFRHFTRPSLPATGFAPLTVWIAERLVGQHRSVVRPIDAIEGLAPRPILLVSGDRDPFVWPDDARRLAERAGPGCQWWLIPEAAHPGSEQDPYRTASAEYRQRVRAVLDRVAPRSRPRRPGSPRPRPAASRATVRVPQA